MATSGNAGSDASSVEGSFTDPGVLVGPPAQLTLFARATRAPCTAVRFVLAGALIAAAAGCSGRDDRQDLSPRILRVPLPRDVLTLDPAHADDINTYNVVRQLYESLVDYDPRSLTVVPRIARAWTASPDGLVWTFELDRGARFVDDACFPLGRGRAVTADDARYSIERGFRPFHGGAPPAGAPPIAGLAAFLERKASHVSGLRVESSSRLSVRLLRPDGNLLYFLVRPLCALVPHEAVESYGERIAAHPVGTGPFRLASWDPLAGILLVRNRDYWKRDEQGGRLPYVDAVELIPIWSEDQNRLYAEKKIDMVVGERGAIDSSEQRVQNGRGGTLPGSPRDEQLFRVSHLNTIYIRFEFRSRHPIVQSRRARLALSFAVPRLLSATRIPARGLFPPGLPGFDPSLKGQGTDPTTAARLLDEAGCAGGRKLPPLKVAWRDWDSGAAKGIESALERLGLPVQLRIYSDRDYWKQVEGGDVDLFRDGWMADYPDPQNFLEIFFSGSAANRGGYANPTFDRLFTMLQAEKDPLKRTVQARVLEKILIEDTAAVFLHHERESQFVSPRVANWRENCTNPLNLCFYERIRLTPESKAEP